MILEVYAQSPLVLSKWTLPGSIEIQRSSLSKLRSKFEVDESYLPSYDVCVRVVSLFLMVCQEEQKPISCSAEFPDAAGAGGIPSDHYHNDLNQRPKTIDDG